MSATIADIAGGSSLILLQRTFMLSGLLVIGTVVVLGQSLGLTAVVPLAVSIGVLAGLVDNQPIHRQFLDRHHVVDAPADGFDSQRTPRPQGQVDLVVVPRSA